MKIYTILIADDLPENLQIIAESLGEMELPHKIIKAPNGKILCELAAKRVPDLIITDWEMPEMDGIQAIKYLKNLDSTKDIPIIMCTGIMTSSSNLKMAMDSGAVDYIRKPIDSIELRSRVYSMLKLADSYHIIKQQNLILEQQKEELSSSNEKLHNQKEELSFALNKLKITQEQLVQSEKMASLGVLAAGVAHEINNPLNFIQGGIYYLDNFFNHLGKDHLDEITPIIRGIQEGVNRVEAIVNSLTRYSRYNDLVKEACNINLIIDNCLLMLQGQIKSSIEIQKNFAHLPQIFICNESKLHQAFFNILANAVQAIGDKGIISITTKLEKEKLKIIITDTGDGIRKEDMPKIFDPFFTTKDPGKGIGLGLSITYNIIKEHKGTLEYKSELGKGTKAIIKLPVKKS